MKPNSPKQLYIVLGPNGVIRVRCNKRQGLRALRQTKFENKLARSSDTYILVKYVIAEDQL